jgi:outer membrane protein assembly factor BamB
VLGIGLALVTACGDRAEAKHEFVKDSDQPMTVSQIPDSKFRSMKQTSFERSWDLKLGSKALGSWISPSVPELVFFQTASDNAMVAVDTMSGATRWVSMPFPKPLRLPPYVERTVLRDQTGHPYNDDRLYLISDDILFCVDVRTGQLVWRYELPFSPSTGPCAVGIEGDLRVFVGDWEGRVRVTTLHPDKGFPYGVWQWNTGVDLSAQPYSREGLVYVGDHGGTLRCFALDRDQKWQFPAGGQIYGSAVARDRVLYFGSTDNVLYALNRLSGERLGQLNLNGPIRRAPMLFGDETKRVYVWVTSSDRMVSGLYAVRAVPDVVTFPDNTPEHPHTPLEIVRLGVDWHFPGVTRIVGSTPQHLFLSYPESTVVAAVRRDNGQLDWAWDCAEDRSGKNAPHVNLVTEYQDPTDLNRSIFTCDDKGQVIAYRFFGYVPNPDSNRVAGAAAPAAAEPPPAPKSHKKAKDKAE